jgi:hypothetical protein
VFQRHVPRRSPAQCGTPVLAPDLAVAAALDASDTTHLADLATGRGRKLGRCEVARAIDQSARLATLDGQMLCTDYNGPARLPGPGVSSRVIDLRTGRTMLDLGNTVVWGAVFGPPGDDGPAGIVAVENGKSGVVTVHDLTTGAEVGRYVPDEGMFPLNLAMSPDGRRLALTMTTGQLVVVDVAALATVDDSADAVEWTVTAHAESVQAVSNAVLRRRSWHHPAVHRRPRRDDPARPVARQPRLHRRRMRPVLPHRALPNVRPVARRERVRVNAPSRQHG